MLKDLEARRASGGQPPGEMAQIHELPGVHVDDLRHTDVTPPIERDMQRRLSWLFWPFLFVLLAMVAALYLWRSGDYAPLAGQGDATHPSGVEIHQAPHATPAPEPSVTVPSQPIEASDVHAGREARLVMLSAVDEGRALRLELAFDHPLREAVRLSRVGEQVELYLPGIRSATVESPHPRLHGWRSERAGDVWRLGFTWPATADVRLQPRRGDEGAQHWELILAWPASVGREAAPLQAKGAHDLPITPSSVQKETLQAPTTPLIAQGPHPAEASPKVASFSPNLTPAQRMEALYAEAWQLQQKGRIELAIEKLRQVLQIQPEYVRARELLVRLLMLSGQFRDAEIELVRGLEIQSRQPELVELMARMLADQGRVQEALAFLRARMQTDRLAHQALFAALAARAGDHLEAAEAYRHAAELDPRDPRWLLGRAIALENSGQPAAARAIYAQALGLEGLDAALRAYAQERLQHLGQREVNSSSNNRVQ
ncbi:MAG: tetratricopeptide repeat protein [Halothiobacillaceae bacterium]